MSDIPKEVTSADEAASDREQELRLPKDALQLPYASDGWEIDLARRELRSRGVPVPLGSRAFEIVEVLVQSAGELIDKSELMSRVWPGAVVEDNALQFHISAIRKALGPNRGILKTVSGHGYRLLGNWTVRQAGKLEHRPDYLERKPRQSSRTNIPIAGSALIGRSAARQHLLNVFSAYRVVTLTGPPGIGKSALALEVARSLFLTFEGDRCLVELASLSDPVLVPSAVVPVLGLRIGGTVISAESVARAIGSEKLLLVLDNCEHLADAAARLAEALVRMCPNASVLATSREILRTEGEYVYRVPPLDVPPPDRESAVNVDDYSSVQLFTTRFMALDSGFSAAAENLPMIASICRQLDGIPLAIEFAAAGAAMLGLQEVADHLHDRFSLLTAGRRTALPRHQTLRATLDWSYERLSDAERILLQRLSIFVGGFTFEAVAAVMTDTGATASAVAEGIASLVAKSLVSLDTSVPPGRWRLLETIRAYGLDKLAETGATDQVARRHTEFFRDLFAPAAESPRVTLDDPPFYIRDIDNLRAALDWAFSDDHADAPLRIGLAVAAAPVLLATSMLPECHRWSERAILVLGNDMRGTSEEMRLQAALGVSLMSTQGFSDAARAALDRSLVIAEERGDILYQMWLLVSLNIFHVRNGNFTTALQHARRGSATASIMGDPAAIVLAHFLLGNSLLLVGDLGGASAELEAALLHRPRSQQSGRTYLGYDYDILATIASASALCLQGYPQQAAERARRTIEEAERIANPIVLSIVLRHAMVLFLWIGDLPYAEELVDWFISNARSHSLAPQIAAGRGLKGELAIRRGDAPGGVDSLQGCLEELRTAHYGLMLSAFHISLAEGLAATGRFVESLRLVDDGIRLVEIDGDMINMPELLRVKGAVLAAMPQPRVDEAEANFVRALELSRRQGARASELRTAIDLASLMAAQGHREDARGLLEPIFAVFAEGHDTADLKRAQNLLATLR
jgi:predicted ATPase/DNA-binding winged helix-turn-helix (wHTH) protein